MSFEYMQVPAREKSHIASFALFISLRTVMDACLVIRSCLKSRCIWVRSASCNALEITSKLQFKRLKPRFFQKFGCTRNTDANCTGAECRLIDSRPRSRKRSSWTRDVFVYINRTGQSVDSWFGESDPQEHFRFAFPSSFSLFGFVPWRMQTQNVFESLKK